MTMCAFTSFTYSYLNRARVLARSLKALHPDWHFLAVIVDEPPPEFVLIPEAEPFDEIINARDLYDITYESWLFGLDVVEACTAVKGRALEMLLGRPGHEKIFYFDPDIALFNVMTPVVELLDVYSLVFTPHQTVPEITAQAIVDNEITSLHLGTYNLGFLAVRNDANAREFAAWWRARLDEYCHDRRDIGVFVDQKWCNLAPCYFDGVFVLRDPGYNVASWNLSHRRIGFLEDGTIAVNGSPLRFFHFTKLGPIADEMTERYAGDNVEVYEIWTWYRNAVASNSDAAIPERYWYYGAFANKTPITKTMRERYRADSDLRIRFSTPFNDGFRSWATREGV